MRAFLLFLALAACAARAHADRRYASGVPLGGIGAGKLEIFDDGSLGEATFHHNWDDPLPLAASLFAIRVDGAEGAIVRALRTTPALSFEPVAGARFDGLFPFARFEFDGLPVEATLEAFSPLVPGDAELSGTPAAIFVLRVRNAGPAPKRVALLAGFENLLGCGGPRRRRLRDRTGNFVDGLARHGYAGVRLVTDRTFGDERRNHLGEHALLVDPPAGATVSIRAYDAAGDGADLHGDFAADGALGGGTALRGVEGKVHPAGAVAAAFEVPAGAGKECAFAFAWRMPHRVTEDGEDHPPAYSRRFASAADAAASALRDRAAWAAATREWQDLLFESTLPGWLARALCDDAAPLFANTVWSADGTFATLESPVGGDGTLGAMDRRLASHALPFSFFPGLEREELRLFARAQHADGSIPDSCGNLHAGFGARAATPARTETAAAFVLQVERFYRWSGDRSFLQESVAPVRRALEWLAARDVDRDGLPEGEARTASLQLAALRAGQWIGATVGDTPLEQACATRFEEARRAAIAQLWNGRWFSKSFDAATGARSDACTLGQCAGEWFTTLLASDTLVPASLLDRALDSMLRLNGRVSPHLPPSEVGPDGGWAEAPDASLAEAEAFLGCLAIARGRANEGLEVLAACDRTVRRTNASPWNAAARYDARSGRASGAGSSATSPASWFVLPALAGFALDLPEGVLRLEPNFPDGRTTMRLPLFGPGFVARLDAEAPGASTGRSIRFEVVKTFAGEPLRVERIETRLPLGNPRDGDAAIPVRVLLDEVLQEATVRRVGERVVARLARPVVLERGRTLALMIGGSPGVLDLDAASGAARLLGGAAAVVGVARADGELRLRVRNDSTVDHAIHLRVRNWPSAGATLEPGSVAASREELEAGLAVLIPGRAFPAAEIERRRALAARVAAAASALAGAPGAATASSPSDRTARLAVAATRWAESLGAAPEATGITEIVLAPAPGSTAEASPASTVASPLAAAPTLARNAMRRRVEDEMDPALDAARREVASAPAGSTPRALEDALRGLSIEGSAAERAAPGAPFALRVVVRNESERRVSGAFAIAAPEGFTVDAPSVEVEDLAPGDAFRSAHTLTPPAAARADRREVVELRSRFAIAGTVVSRTDRFPVGRSFVTAWSAVGPFENADDAGLSVALAPETAADLAARFQGKGGEVAWKPARVREGFVDFEATFGRTDRAVGYATAWIHSPGERDARIEFGSDDGAKVWVEDALVFEKHAHRAARAGEDRIPVRLRQGWNRVLVKVEETDGEWGFFFEIAGPDGEGLDDLSFRDSTPDPAR